LGLYYRFISISDALPKSSGIRFVDVWMLFSLFLSFFEVFIQTYISFQQQKVDEEESKKMAVLGQQVVCWPEKSETIAANRNVDRLQKSR
jgi:hypothetical protein